MARRTRPTSRAGFTLAESLIASVVLAVAVVAVSGSIIASQQQTLASEGDSFAVSLGKQLIEEIASTPLNYADATAGFPTVTDRTTYDSAYDFNGYTDRVTNAVHHTSDLTETGTFSTATPSVTVVTSGTPTPAAEEYVRTVTVSYPSSIFGKTVAASDFAAGDFALVKVNVKGGKGANVTLSRILSKTTVTR